MRTATHLSSPRRGNRTLRAARRLSRRRHPRHRRRHLLDRAQQRQRHRLQRPGHGTPRPGPAPHPGGSARRGGGAAATSPRTSSWSGSPCRRPAAARHRPQARRRTARPGSATSSGHPSCSTSGRRGAAPAARGMPQLVDAYGEHCKDEGLSSRNGEMEAPSLLLQDDRVREKLDYILGDGAFVGTFNDGSSYPTEHLSLRHTGAG